MSEELKGVLSYGGQRGPQGPQGEPGPQGPTGEIGAMGPTGDCGVYVGTTQPTDPDVYVWINPEGSETPVIGPTGPTGPTGSMDIPQAYGQYDICRGQDGNLYYHKHNPDKGTIVYHTDYGIQPTGQLYYFFRYFTENQLPTLTAEGHIFCGWYMDIRCTIPATTSTFLMDDAYVNLYALWDYGFWTYIKDENDHVIEILATSGVTQFNSTTYNNVMYPNREYLETIDFSASTVNNIASDDTAIFNNSRPMFPNLTSFIFPTNPSGGYLTLEGENVLRETGITGALNYQKFASLPKNCFAISQGITSVNIGGTFTVIPDSCFFNCQNIVTADLRGATNLTTLRTVSFQGCTSLTTVYLPASIQYIDFGAFGDRIGTMENMNLSTIYFEGTITQWNAIVFNGDHGGSGDHTYIDWNRSCPQITVHCTDGDIVIPANR